MCAAGNGEQEFFVCGSREKRSRGIFFEDLMNRDSDFVLRPRGFSAQIAKVMDGSGSCAASNRWVSFVAKSFAGLVSFSLAIAPISPA